MEGTLEDVTREEVKAAMRMFKAGKAAGSSEVTSEMLSMVGDTGIGMLLEVFQNIVKSDLPPEKWSKSITVLLFKGKDDALECGKNRGLRLLEQGMKIWERVLMQKLEVYVPVEVLVESFPPPQGGADDIGMPPVPRVRRISSPTGQQWTPPCGHGKNSGRHKG